MMGFNVVWVVWKGEGNVGAKAVIVFKTISGNLHSAERHRSPAMWWVEARCLFLNNNTRITLQRYVAALAGTVSVYCAYTLSASKKQHQFSDAYLHRRKWRNKNVPELIRANKKISYLSGSRKRHWKFSRSQATVSEKCKCRNFSAKMNEVKLVNLFWSESDHLLSVVVLHWIKFFTKP